MQCQFKPARAGTLLHASMVFPLHLDKTERQQEIPSLDKTQKIENYAIGKAYKLHLDKNMNTIEYVYF